MYHFKQENSQQTDPARITEFYDNDMCQYLSVIHTNVFFLGMPECLWSMTSDHKPYTSNEGFLLIPTTSIKVSRHLSMAGDFRSL